MKSELSMLAVIQKKQGRTPGISLNLNRFLHPLVSFP